MKKKDKNSETPEKEQVPESPQPQPEAEQPEVAQDAQADAEQEASIDQWREALETAVKQRDEYLDSLRRSQADFQNFRRRNQTARADGYADGAREVIAALLPAIDNLERAMAAAGESPLLEGVRMTHNQLLESLKKFGLEEIPALGEAFDPELHHAVLKEVTDEPGKVIEVLQKGYRVKDKIIRYAMVKVSVEE